MPHENSRGDGKQRGVGGVKSLVLAGLTPPAGLRVSSRKIHKGGETVAMRGRKPKPTAIKELEGNPGKRPLPNEPTFSPVFPKTPPKWLSKEAQKLWGELVPMLQSVPGLLQSVDVSAVELLCESYAQWKAAAQVLQEHGQTFTTPNGYVQQRPEVAIAQKNAKLVKELCAEFGLTPSSRSRINLKLPEGDDGFDDF